MTIWNRTARVAHAATGGGYDLTDAGPVAVRVRDDDTAGLIVAPDSLTVSEAGGMATYTVALTAGPTADVTVRPTSEDPSAVTASPSALTFTATNWSVGQTVTVTGVDNGASGDRMVLVTHSATGGGYGLGGAAAVEVTVTEDSTRWSSGDSTAGSFAIAGMARGMAGMGVDVIGNRLGLGARAPGGGAVAGRAPSDGLQATVGGTRFDMNAGAGGLLRGAADLLGVDTRRWESLAGDLADLRGPADDSASAGGGRWRALAAGLAEELGRGLADNPVGHGADPFGNSGDLGGPLDFGGGYGSAGGGFGASADRGGLLRGAAAAFLGRGSGGGGLPGLEMPRLGNLPLNSFDVTHQGRTAAGEVRGFSIWGQAGRRGFSGRTALEHAVEGEIDGYYLGTDYTRGGATFGVSVARHSSSVTLTGEDLRLDGVDASVTTVMPYARVSPWRGASLWGAVGMGWGDASIDREAGVVETPLNLRTAAVGATSDLAHLGALVLALKADAFWTGTAVDSSDALPELDVAVHRGRLALDTRLELGLGQHSRLVPNVEAAARLDGGDAENGLGMELGGGLLFANSRLGLDMAASGRWLVSHEDGDLEEWGASVLIRLGPGRSGEPGLSLSVEPAWGNVSSRADELWGNGHGGSRLMAGPTPTAPIARAGATDRGAGQLNVDVNYGIRAFGDGSVDLFGQSGVEAAARRFQVGTRLRLPRALDDGPLNVELLAERMGDPAGAPSHLLGLNLGGDLRQRAGPLAPFAEFRYGGPESRRLRVGTTVVSRKVDFGFLSRPRGLHLQVFGEHLARRGEDPYYHVGVRASFPKIPLGQR